MRSVSHFEKRLRVLLLAALVAALMSLSALPAAAWGGGNSQGQNIGGGISPQNITWE